MRVGEARQVPHGLKHLGFDAAMEEKIEIGAGYTTRVYRRKPSDLGGKLAVVVAGSAPNWRNGVVLAQSADRWIVSIGGYLGDHAPVDEQMFAAYAASMTDAGDSSGGRKRRAALGIPDPIASRPASAAAMRS